MSDSELRDESEAHAQGDAVEDKTKAAVVSVDEGGADVVDGVTDETADDRTETLDQGPETPDQGPETPFEGSETPFEGSETPFEGSETPDEGPETPDEGPVTPDEGQEMLNEEVATLDEEPEEEGQETRSKHGNQEGQEEEGGQEKDDVKGDGGGGGEASEGSGDESADVEGDGDGERDEGKREGEEDAENAEEEEEDGGENFEDGENVEEDAEIVEAESEEGESEDMSESVEKLNADANSKEGEISKEEQVTVEEQTPADLNDMPESEEELEGVAKDEGELQDGETNASQEEQVDEQDGEEKQNKRVKEALSTRSLEPQPLQFQLRKTAPDEFNLEKEFDENELLADIDEVRWFSGSSASTATAAEKSGHADIEIIDREVCYERYRELTAQRTLLIRKNKVLQRKLFMHYKTRKQADMFQKSEEVSAEMMATYGERLSLFSVVLAVDVAERAVGAEEIAALEAKRAILSKELEEELDNLLVRERETGTGLIDSRNGKVLPEKLVEKLLKRQNDRVKELLELLIIFAKYQANVAVKEKAMVDVEDLGEGIKMGEYEQLRIENQNLTDKLEERDEECVRLRAHTKHSLTALAHIREKVGAVQGAIDKQREKLTLSDSSLEMARNTLNKNKGRSGKLRAELRRETHDAGILLKPQLMRDYEDTVTERQALRKELEALQVTGATEKRQLKPIRATFERGAAGTLVSAPRPRMTYMGQVHQRLEEQHAKREEAKIRPLVMKLSREAIFRMH